MTDHGDKKGSQRLPVNPRRHKVAPEQRKRVATACNSCNVRRIKCSGEKPCKQCRSSSRECAYPAAVEKVTVPKPELDDLRRQLDNFERALRDAVPDSDQRRELLRRASGRETSSTPPGQHSFSSMPTPDSASEHPGRQSFNSLRTTGTGESVSSLRSESVETDQVVPLEGRLLRDPSGSVRFFGETNENVFLDIVKDYFSVGLQSTSGTFLSTAGLYQSEDSSEILKTDVDPIWLPSAAHVGVGLSELRHFIQDGAGRWLSGGLYYWGELSTLPTRPLVSGLETADVRQYRHLAFYQAALALACRATTTDAPTSASQQPLCETYFARASILIGNPLDVSQHVFGDAATLALMAFYLIETNRQDTAYMYIGAATRVCLIEGAHRGLTEESGKRVFWTVFVLDRWLAMLTGRPPSIPDGSVRSPMPLDAPGLPNASGLRAHIELARISDHIVNEVHSVAPELSGSTLDSSQNADRALAMLDEWRHSLPGDLLLSRDGLSQDPSCCLLHMLHNQLLILATRSWLLRVVQDRLTTGEEPRPPAPHVKICMAAARHNVRLARHLLIINNPRKLLHQGLQLLLSSAVCILMQELAYTWAMPQDELATGHRMVDFAIETLDADARTGSSFGRDGSHTLRELRLLITQISLGAQSTPGSSAEQMHLSRTGPSIRQDNSDPTHAAVLGDLIRTLDDGWMLGHPNQL
ncbi:fungal specific transcription factor domain-containing protein [Sarocladium implicatum]|nr:fungal specific transcription factor domain-containing protein [Sarocladium implicatum]